MDEKPQRVTLTDLRRMVRARQRVEVEWWDASTACENWGERAAMRKARLARNKSIGYLMHATPGDASMIGRVVLAQSQCTDDGMSSDGIVIPLVNLIAVRAL